MFSLKPLEARVQSFSVLCIPTGGTHITATPANISAAIEQFSFECQKVIGFAITTLRDWLKRFAPLFHPIRSKTKTNCEALACIFLRFASATCNYFEF